MSSNETTLSTHIAELRNRIYFILLSLVVGASIGFLSLDQLVAVALAPLQGRELYYSSPHGGFEFMFKILATTGVLVSLPVAAYHLISYVSPAFTNSSKRDHIIFAVKSGVLGVVGMCFAYFVALPASLSFLAEIGSDFLTSLLSTNEYLSFVAISVIGFAVLFQLPLIMTTINRHNPLQPMKLLRKIKYVVVGSYVIAALVTPTPDAINQSFMALPMIVLYGVGIIAIAYGNYRNNRATATREEKPIFIERIEISKNREAPSFGHEAAIGLQITRSAIRQKSIDGIIQPSMQRSLS